MTQEEKLLLLEDLSSRLMYGVIVDYKDNEYDRHKWKITTLFAPAYSQDGTLIDTDHEGWIGYDDYKGCGMSSGSRPLHLEKSLPYLRPLSSMTDEEKYQYEETQWEYQADYCAPEYFDGLESYDWLNAHFFDFRGLIEKGLALEAPEGMYNN